MFSFNFFAFFLKLEINNRFFFLSKNDLCINLDPLLFSRSMKHLVIYSLCDVVVLFHPLPTCFTYSPISIFRRQLFPRPLSPLFPVLHLILQFPIFLFFSSIFLLYSFSSHSFHALYFSFVGFVQQPLRLSNLSSFLTLSVHLVFSIYK